MKRYKKHKNFCCRLYKKERKNYFHTLDVNKITDNKAFEKNIQPLFFSDSEENATFDDLLVSEKLKIFFPNPTKILYIYENSHIVDSTSSNTDPVDKATKTCKNHPKILLIKRTFVNVDYFSFKEVSVSEIELELRELNSN